MARRIWNFELLSTNIMRRRFDDPPANANPSGRDLLSPLSDELLLRILSFLPLPQLLSVAPVSRRFYQLAADSQLWKALYYARFVLPRAMRIPGFRDGPSVLNTGNGAATRHKLHYSGRRSLWADGRRGGLVREEERGNYKEEDVEEEEDPLVAWARDETKRTEAVNWKRQYKIRHNWSRGKCAVEELRIGDGPDGHARRQEDNKILAKVIEGFAITADPTAGMRAWDLKSRRLLAQIDLDGADAGTPSCMAIDDSRFYDQILDIAVGFLDGSFGVWRLNLCDKSLVRRYRHEKSSNGELIAMAFSFPYLLTATASVLVSLYNFRVPRSMVNGQNGGLGSESAPKTNHDPRNGDTRQRPKDKLEPPYLLTSLNSHTSRPPLALSIRTMAATTIASIAYTFSTRQGWSIGIQDLHVRSTGAAIGVSSPEVVATKIAYTAPVDSGSRGMSRRHGPGSGFGSIGSVSPPRQSMASPAGPAEPGPTTLCYSHPYLLATLPDNTLVLHMCKSSPAALEISPGIRLWGHTSGISDAEITARGKAVSVSSRGEEMRVWELEGRSSGVGSRSVEIRPGQAQGMESTALFEGGYDWDERRNWVGFDDEMVIVLKEKAGGGESLMVYDFT
ncbi:F-box only protein 15 [Echria macrotheca]|uniref:F-box only protein 15 n=1 Tax=Echria macrotheca TaxID=438768 RepID=A0AAJ0BHR0_9PEZI|nr:F-box only protein 15 [Echria macrotheca]